MSDDQTRGGQGSRTRKETQGEARNGHDYPWHALSARQALALLHSSEAGLSSEEATKRLAKEGANVLTRIEGETFGHLLRRQFQNPLTYVLLAASILAFWLGLVLDGVVLLIAVSLNLAIGLVQAYRANRSFDALIKIVPDEAAVLRGGQKLSVPAEDLVPGDIVTLEADAWVPADLRLLSSYNLRVKQSALTGESLPVDKHADPAPEEVSVGDRHSMLHSGTYVSSGGAAGIVVATGMATELGHLAGLIQRIKHDAPPFSKTFNRVGWALSIAIAVLAALVALGGVWRDFSFAEIKLTVSAIAVGAAPVGLPILVTVALAAGIWRLIAHRVALRHLAATETLGGVTAILANKTGALTHNEMTATSLWTPPLPFHLSGQGYAPEGQLLSFDDEQVRLLSSNGEDLLTVGVISSEARLQRDRLGWFITGDPVEGALVVAGYKLGLNAERLRESYPRLDTLPFKTWRGFTASSHSTPAGYGLISLRGDPDEVLPRCVVQSDGHDLDMAHIRREAEAWAARGLRVVALAERRMPEPAARILTSDVEDGFTFLGLVGVVDPVRTEARSTLQVCRGAGLSVKMITGDHAATARLTGQDLGLLREGDEVITGEELAALSDARFAQAVRDYDVFARVTPEQKVQLVKALQADGHVVAVPGDGVNDAPALKQADVGISMGVSGTSVAKEVADVVLANDNIGGLLSALQEGGKVRTAVTRLLTFALPVNIALLAILAVSTGYALLLGDGTLLPLLPTQALWVHLVANLLLGLPLALESIPTPLGSRQNTLLSRANLTLIALMSVLLTLGTLALSYLGLADALADSVSPERTLARVQTLTVTGIVLAQLAYLFAIRAPTRPLSLSERRNPWVVLTVGVLAALQLAFIYLPGMNATFGSAPIDSFAWFKAGLLGLGVLVVMRLSVWWLGRPVPEAETSEVLQPSRGDS